jgi:hypothetical protein
MKLHVSETRGKIHTEEALAMLRLGGSAVQLVCRNVRRSR